MEKKLFFRRFTAAAVASIAIFFSTCKASDYITNSLQIKQIEFIQNLVLRKDLLPRYVLTDRRFYDISEKYLESLMRAVFSFEILPTKELDTFLHFIININSETNVLNFEFEGHNMIVTMEAEKAETLDDVFMMLSADEYFDSVSIVEIEDNDARVVYTLRCKPKKHPPKVDINTDILNVFNPEAKDSQ